MTAEFDISTANEWWREHRQAAPGLLLREVEAACERIARQPRIGTAYLGRPGDLRRLLLRRIGHHLYYGYAPSQRVVIVRGLWHAARTLPPDR
ncbi:MAG: hypothetical protein WBO45_26235 [Planctomycetota bacterium]